MPNPRLESEVLITSQADQLIIGTTLGDGNIAVPCANPRLSITHRLEDLPYLEWKYNILKSCGLVEAPLYFPSYERSARLNSICTPALWKYRQLFYDGVGRKRVTKQVINSLTSFSLAIWYMDDGGFSLNEGHPRVTIYTLAFTQEEVVLLRDGIRDKFSVEFRVPLYRPQQWVLEITRRAEAFKFIELVQPYMQYCMNRKCPSFSANRCQLSLEAKLKFKTRMQELWGDPSWRKQTIKARHYKDRRLPLRYCVYCGTEFHPRYSSQKFCSVPCVCRFNSWYHNPRTKKLLSSL